jgi:hypothetical protein
MGYVLQHNVSFMAGQRTAPQGNDMDRSIQRIGNNPC